MSSIFSEEFMTDRRRGTEFKTFSGYLRPRMINRIKAQMRLKGLNQSEAMEKAFELWLGEEKTPDGIYGLVAEHLIELQNCGISPEVLDAIARGEALPTPADFNVIVTTLNISETEKERLWKLAYLPGER